MPRAKNRGAARAGRGGRGGVRGNGRLATGHHTGQSGLQEPSSHTPNVFTLADEARQTSQQDHSTWSQNVTLRKKPVAFVSAGPSQPLEPVEDMVDAVEFAEETQLKSGAAQNNQNVLSERPSTALAGGSGAAKHPDAEETPTLEGEPLFFFDVSGQSERRQAKHETIIIPERPSPSDTSSGDEVILFRGRRPQNKIQRPPSISLGQMTTEIRAVEQQIHVAQSKCLSPREHNDGMTLRASHKQRGKRGPRRKRDEDQGIIADYISNMRDNGELEEFSKEYQYNQRDLGGTDSDVDHDPVIRKIKIKDTPYPAEEYPNSDEETGGSTSRKLRHSESDNKQMDDTTKTAVAGKHGEKGTYIEHNIGNDIPSDTDSSSVAMANDQARTAEDNGFDLMDWERPSLRRKKRKGTLAHLAFNESDSELEQQLQAAWNNDRMKKSQRKKHREELRALGMLGKKSQPDDLRVKYPLGMSTNEVAEELRIFLLNEDELLTMPPMDKHARKIVHELANKFNVKSKSIGKADQRRPILYRTKRTLPYVEEIFDQVISRMSRRFLPRLDNKGKRAARPMATRSNDTAATVRDGEIVGAAAPELGSGNRGHAMLEKMGWSSGTALGATNNKGILQPVTHAMKRTKAGLS